MISKIKYLKSIKKENYKLLDKYKKIILDLDNVEHKMKNKIDKENKHLEDIKKIYFDSMDYYHKICENLIE